MNPSRRRRRRRTAAGAGAATEASTPSVTGSVDAGGDELIQRRGERTAANPKGLLMRIARSTFGARFGRPNYGEPEVGRLLRACVAAVTKRASRAGRSPAAMRTKVSARS